MLCKLSSFLAFSDFVYTKKLAQLFVYWEYTFGQCRPVTPELPLHGLAQQPLSETENWKKDNQKERKIMGYMENVNAF